MTGFSDGNSDKFMNEDIDNFRYSIFPNLTNIDIFKYAVERNARNFFIFINPEKSEDKFSEINSVALAKRFDELYPNKQIAVRYNKTKAIVFNTNDAKIANEILNKKEILGIPVNTKLATDNIISRIIIRQVTTSLSITQVVEEIEFRNNIKILAARRFFWKDTATQTILLTIPGQSIPLDLKCGHTNFPVEVYIDKPILCKACFHYGHVKNKCKEKPRCKNCGTVLITFDETTKQELVHDDEKCDIINCIHCEEDRNHKTNDNKCPEFITNDKIIKISKQRNVPIFEAKRIYYAEAKKPSFANIVSSRNTQQYDIDFPELISKLKTDIKQEIRELFTEFKEAQDKKIESIIETQDKKIVTLFKEHDKKIELLIEKQNQKFTHIEKKFEQVDKQLHELDKDIVRIKDCDRDLRAEINVAFQAQQNDFQKLFDKRFNHFESLIKSFIITDNNPSNDIEYQNKRKKVESLHSNLKTIKDDTNNIQKHIPASINILKKSLLDELAIINKDVNPTAME